MYAPPPQHHTNQQQTHTHTQQKQGRHIFAGNATHLLKLYCPLFAHHSRPLSPQHHPHHPPSPHINIQISREQQQKIKIIIPTRNAPAPAPAHTPPHQTTHIPLPPASSDRCTQACGSARGSTMCLTHCNGRTSLSLSRGMSQRQRGGQGHGSTMVSF